MPSVPQQPVPSDMPLMPDGAQGGRQFAFLLVDKFPMFSLSAAIDVCRSANRLLGYDFYRWTTVSPDGDTVVASNGLPLKVDYSIADVPQVDILFVCVAINVEFPGKSKVLGALRNWGRRGQALGGLSVGSYCWPRPASSTAIAAPSIGKTGPASPSVSPISIAPATSSRSTASATPVPAAPPPLT